SDIRRAPLYFISVHIQGMKMNATRMITAHRSVMKFAPVKSSGSRRDCDLIAVAMIRSLHRWGAARPSPRKGVRWPCRGAGRAARPSCGRLLSGGLFFEDAQALRLKILKNLVDRRRIAPEQRERVQARFRHRSGRVAVVELRDVVGG